MLAKIVLFKFPDWNPLKRCMFGGQYHFTGIVFAEISKIEKRLSVTTPRSIVQGNAYRNIESKFFLIFTSKCLFRRFAMFDPTAAKFPSDEFIATGKVRIISFDKENCILFFI